MAAIAPGLYSSDSTCAVTSICVQRESVCVLDVCMCSRLVCLSVCVCVSFVCVCVCVCVNGSFSQGPSAGLLGCPGFLSLRIVKRGQRQSAAVPDRSSAAPPLRHHTLTQQTSSTYFVILFFI